MWNQLAISIAAFVVCLPAVAAEIRVDEVVATDGKIACLAHSDLLLTVVSGPCDSFSPPPRIAVGQVFTANGQRQIIKVIIASQAESDLSSYGLDIKKGEWTCVAARSDEDLPSDEERSRNWLYIKHCKIVREVKGGAETSGGLQTITVEQYLKLPQEFQVLYVGGIIDGMDYVMYGYDLSDRSYWLSCVRSETLGQLLEEVADYLRSQPGEKDLPLPYAVAKALGGRGCPRH